MYNEGISSTGALLDFALEKQIVEKRGSWLNLQKYATGTGKRCGQVRIKIGPEIIRGDRGGRERRS